eukprot:4731394-Pyramimonas_sp.AAC.1
MKSHAGASSVSALRGSLGREPRPYVSRTSSGASLVSECEEVSGGDPLPMGPALHVGNPSGLSETCNCRLFWAPQ